MQGDGKPETSNADAEQAMKLLEIELMAKRMARQQAGSRRGTWRALGFLFLLAVIAAVAAAFYYASTLRERAPRANPGAPDAAAAHP